MAGHVVIQTDEGFGDSAYGFGAMNLVTAVRRGKNQSRANRLGKITGRMHPAIDEQQRGQAEAGIARRRATAIPIMASPNNASMPGSGIAEAEADALTMSSIV
jgi:hypothetical protein